MGALLRWRTLIDLIRRISGKRAESFTVGSHLDPSSFPSKPNKASCIVFLTSALTFKWGNFFKHVFVKVCSEQPSSIIFLSLRLADSEHASKLFAGIAGMV